MKKVSKNSPKNDEVKKYLDVLMEHVDDKFKLVNERFDGIDQRLDIIDSNIEVIKTNLTQKVERYEFEALNKRVSTIEHKILK